MSIHADSLSRTIKLELDEGRARSLADAERITAGYLLQIDVGPEIADCPTMQAMLLTAINTGTRAFPGGVHVRTIGNPTLATGWARHRTLAEIAGTYGATITHHLETDRPTLVIGTPTAPAGEPILHLTWDGWIGAAVTDPADRLPEHGNLPLAGVLAAALGVSEMFQHLRGGTRTGYRDIGISLWQPATPWRDPQAVGPHCAFLPTRLYLAGLGHLGQAICWALGMLPYPDPSSLEVTLQDFDKIIEANASTGLLTTTGDIGQPKTRIVAEQLEDLGIKTVHIERRVDANTRRTQDEPTWALAGFDKVAPRRDLADAGFARLIDIGLGARAIDYLDILIHVFPGSVDPADAWPDPKPAHVDLAPAYQNALEEQIRDGTADGDARCGLITAAGVSVAAAFVGATAACLALSEVLRALHGGTADGTYLHDVISVTLANPHRLDAVPASTPSIDNPGYVTTAESR